MNDSSDATWKAAEQAADTLAPQGGILAEADPVGFLAAAGTVAAKAAASPAAVGTAVLRFLAAQAQVGPAALARWAGAEVTPPVAIDGKDRRFADPAWEENPGFFALRQSYLGARRLCDDILAAGRGDPVADGKTRLAADVLFDALAPTNFLITNPAAMKRAFETGGSSLARGTRNFLDDLAGNRGYPRQVDRTPFRLGTNMAATPGKVVFRNELMELIQYAPQTGQVLAAPLLASPPWINKYYIMDLAPGRSFIEWAVRHQRTVFAISYRNPDASMRAVTLDDYLIEGPRTALDVISDITGENKIDIVGLCLGGALTAMLASYLRETHDDRIGSLTLLNTLLDYSEPGVLGVFTDEATVAGLERRMAATGVLEGEQMSSTFDLLRANDLIFNYVVSNWLMGKSPPAFDLLAWNADSTRMPAAMHSFYLRALYLRNELARGKMELAGQRLKLSRVKNDTYIVAAINDHIVPWQASYKSAALLGGSTRFVLSTGGHIAGIVNPPGPKAGYEVADENPATPALWRAAATKHGDSWWQDWATWAASRAGALRSPPAMGSSRYPVTGEAPGDYVHG